MDPLSLIYLVSGALVVLVIYWDGTSQKFKALWTNPLAILICLAILFMAYQGCRLPR